jgi:hypothetical protein
MLSGLSWFSKIFGSRESNSALRALFLGEGAREHVTCLVSTLAYT